MTLYVRKDHLSVVLLAAIIRSSLPHWVPQSLLLC